MGMEKMEKVQPAAEEMDKNQQKGSAGAAIGNDFFVKNHAVINYEEGLLYFTVDKKKK